MEELNMENLSRGTGWKVLRKDLRRTETTDENTQNLDKKKEKKKEDENETDWIKAQKEVELSGKQKGEIQM